MILVVFIFSLAIFGYKEYQKNIKYEKYLSQELFNSYSELIGNIFTIKEVLTSLTSQADSNIKTVLADLLQRTSMLTQELDYYIRTTWIDVIINEYPGITNENKYEILYEENRGGDFFIRNHKWKSIITGLDRVSRNYEGVSQN